MRAIAFCAMLAACGYSDVAPGPRAAPAVPVAHAAPAAPAAPTAPSAATVPAGDARPGPRLPDGIAPIQYDLWLDLDPERATFTGQVAIAITAPPGTARIWLHAVDLDLTRARLRGPGGDEPVRIVPGAGELRGFDLPRPVAGAPITLVIDYTGRVTDQSGHSDKDEEGLFRERTGGQWYLYSQAESVFARRIAPCFDEPRFKPTWWVTVVAPRNLRVLGNAQAEATAILPDGRRQVRFARTAAMPSYLLAVAVGPFALIGAGRLGRGRIPVQLALAVGKQGRIEGVLRELPRIIDAAERYMGAPLPLAKLDIVAVPEFFGAMENPGLITFRAGALFSGEFTEIAAHELVHQWFGDSVTPAWWDQLWLSEAFASWLGDRITRELGGSSPVGSHLHRVDALLADDAIDARALIHPIADSTEVEPAFDALIYEKGAMVLAMFEQFAGADAFRAAVRRYLTTHAGTSVTSQAFYDALAAASRPEVAAALASNLEHVGTPVVEFAIRCTTGEPAAIIATARGDITVPVCVRYPVSPSDTARACFLVGAHSELAVPASAGCPAWLVGNDGGRGYYRTVWRGGRPPADRRSPEERQVHGDDIAFAVRAGDLAFAEALTEITALVATHIPDDEEAAILIADAIDRIADDAGRPAWQRWLYGRFADRLSRAALFGSGSAGTAGSGAGTRSSAGSDPGHDRFMRAALLRMVGDAVGSDAIAAAQSELAHRSNPVRQPVALTVAARRDGEALFDATVEVAFGARDDRDRDGVLALLAGFPPRFAPRVVDLLFGREFAAEDVWRVLAAMLRTGEIRSAAWSAIRARFPAVIAALGRRGARDAIAALDVLCEAGARAELATAAAPQLAAIDDGRRVLDRSLATIDRCVARRAANGDLAAAIAGAH